MASGTQSRVKQVEVGTTRERERYLFTAEQVLKMAEAGIFAEEGHLELWNGVFYKTTKHELHNAVVNEVARLVRAVAPDGYQVREEKSCSADPYSLPEPDLMVYRGGPWDHVQGSPPPLSGMELLVEVNNTTPEDYTRRLAKYANAGVPTYWVVDVKARNVVVFTRPGGGSSRYAESTTFQPGQEIEVVLGGEPRGAIRVDDLFPPIV